MLTKINALPNPHVQFPKGYWNAQVAAQNTAFDMGWHIVRAFCGMNDPALRRVIGGRHQAFEKIVHIHLNIRVCVLLDQERARRVTDEKCEKALVYPGVPHPSGNVTGELVKARAGCGYLKGGLHEITIVSLRLT